MCVKHTLEKAEDLPESRKILGRVGLYTDVSGLCVTTLIVGVHTLMGFENFVLL